MNNIGHIQHDIMQDIEKYLSHLDANLCGVYRLLLISLIKITVLKIAQMVPIKIAVAQYLNGSTNGSVSKSILRQFVSTRKHCVSFVYFPGFVVW